MGLREHFPDLAIVAISGAGGEEDAGPLVDACILGASAALPKPLSVAEFLSTIERVIPPAERRPPVRSSERRNWP